MKDLQTVFIEVVEHLLEQGEDTRLTYTLYGTAYKRYHDGDKKSPLGLFIPKTLYRSEMELESISDIILSEEPRYQLLLEHFKGIFVNPMFTLDLLTDLEQVVHKTMSGAYMISELTKVGKAYGLDTDFMKDATVPMYWT